MKITHSIKVKLFPKKPFLLFLGFCLLGVSSLFSAAADPGPELSPEQYKQEIMKLKLKEVKGELVDPDKLANIPEVAIGPFRVLYQSAELNQGERYRKLGKRIKRARNLSKEEKNYLKTLAEYYSIFGYTRSEKSPGYINPLAIKFGGGGSGLRENFFLDQSFDKDKFCSRGKRVRSQWKKELSRVKRKKLVQAKDYWLMGDIDNSYAACQPLIFVQSTSRAARKSFDRALEIDPSHPLANIGRAVFYYRQAKGKKKVEDLSTAARMLKTAVVNGSDYEKYLAHLWLSQVLLKLDKANTSEAAAEVEKAKRIYSRGPFIDFVSKLLKTGKHI